MTVTKAAVQKLIQELKCRNQNGESWEAIAESFGPLIKRGTIWRIAHEDYFPKDRAILQALGLIQVRQKTEHELRIEKIKNKMVNQTKRAVLRRKP